MTRQIYKEMEKHICIQPVDDEMATLTKAVFVLNEFKKLGFKTRKSFLDLIVSEDDSFLKLDKIDKLNSFWASRIKDDELNNSLEIILLKLKKECE